jgi:transposase
MLRERLNSLSEEHNKDITDQVNIYSKLKTEVIDTNTALSKFMNQIIMLRRQLETEIERMRSMPLSIPISSASSSLSNKIQSNPSNPKSPATINNIGSRQIIGQFTSGMYTY